MQPSDLLKHLVKHSVSYQSLVRAIAAHEQKMNKWEEKKSGDIAELREHKRWFAKLATKAKHMATKAEEMQWTVDKQIARVKRASYPKRGELNSLLKREAMMLRKLRAQAASRAGQEKMREAYDDLKNEPLTTLREYAQNKNPARAPGT